MLESFFIVVEMLQSAAIVLVAYRLMKSIPATVPPPIPPQPVTRPAEVAANTFDPGAAIWRDIWRVQETGEHVRDGSEAHHRHQRRGHTFTRVS